MKRTTLGTKQVVEHHCIGHKEGQWIIFLCTSCGYQRFINCMTKAVVVKKGDPSVIHLGSHAPMATTTDAFSTN